MVCPSVCGQDAVTRTREVKCQDTVTGEDADASLCQDQRPPESDDCDPTAACPRTIFFSFFFLQTSTSSGLNISCHVMFCGNTASCCFILTCQTK